MKIVVNVFRFEGGNYSGEAISFLTTAEIHRFENFVIKILQNGLFNPFSIMFG